MASASSSSPSVSWRDLARDAAVPDLEQFEVCLSEQEFLLRVEYRRNLGERLGLRETPALLVNGIVVPGVPSMLRLRTLVEQALGESG